MERKIAFILSMSSTIKIDLYCIVFVHNATQMSMNKACVTEVLNFR